MRFSLQSKTAEEVINLPKDGGQYFISALIADHLLIESVDDEQDTADQMYALSLSEPQLTPLHQFIEETKEPCRSCIRHRMNCWSSMIKKDRWK